MGFKKEHTYGCPNVGTNAGAKGINQCWLLPGHVGPHDFSGPKTNEIVSKQRLPTDSVERKKTPLWSGLVQYFPDALVAIARLSQVANDQHNPGEPVHWSRGKSSDHEDTLLRHLFDSGSIDTDGQRHTTKVAWRALAMLQLELEKERNATEEAAKRAEGSNT